MFTNDRFWLCHICGIFFSILQVFLTAYFRFPLFYGNAQLVYSVTVNVGHVHKSPVTHWGPIFLEVELTRRVTPACVASQIAVITSIKYLVKKIYSLTHLTLFIPAERYDCFPPTIPFVLCLNIWQKNINAQVFRENFF